MKTASRTYVDNYLNRKYRTRSLSFKGASVWFVSINFTNEIFENKLNGSNRSRIMYCRKEFLKVVHGFSGKEAFGQRTSSANKRIRSSISSITCRQWLHLNFAQTKVCITDFFLW